MFVELIQKKLTAKVTTPLSSVVYGVMMVSAKTTGRRKPIQQIKEFISENNDGYSKSDKNLRFKLLIEVLCFLQRLAG